jgi:hypothetical protein
LDNAEFLIDLGAFYPVKQPDELEEKLVTFLQEKNVYYRILYHSDYFFKEYLNMFFSKYSTLVGVWETGCNSLMCNQNKKQVNLTYGAGKELTQVRFTRRYNDLILAFGDRDQKLFSFFTESKIVGNPKFDDWFNNELDYESIKEIIPKISNNKKTILYLPTHSDLSSLGSLIDELKVISNLYNVIVKMHYFTIREEPEKMRDLSNEKIIILQDDCDLLPLLKVSDVVLSDNSSAIFDAILADKPLVVTDFISKKDLDTKHKKIFMYKRGKSSPLTYSGSIEQLVKRDGSLITIKKPNELSIAIEKALLDDISYKQKREKIKNELFSFNDGKCGFRAAEEIKNISIKKRKTEKPILFHAIESYVSKMGYSSRLTERTKKAELQKYKEILVKIHTKKLEKTGLLFSVFVLDLGEEGLENTLRSLYNQELPMNTYELFVISVSDKELVINNLINLELADDNGIVSFVKKMNFIKIDAENQVGISIFNALRISEGEIVCFTRSGYLLPSDWLSNFILTYERFPSVAGVGGYVVNFPNVKSIFQNFFDTLIKENLGIKKSPFSDLEIYEVKNNSYYQNPAGEFYNMSYKKEILSIFSGIFINKTIKSLEIILKLSIIESYQICFVPYKVYRTELWTFRKFVQENFFLGVAFSTVYDLYQKRPYQYKITFLKSIRISLFQLIDEITYKNVLLAVVMFIGFFSRWVGMLYYKLSKLFTLLEKLEKIK